MSEDISTINNSIDMERLSELNPIKRIETMKAKNIIKNAILIGIQNAINRRGQQYNVPPSIRQNMINEVQHGGLSPFSAAKSTKELQKVSSLKDIKNEGIKEGLSNALSPDNPDFQKSSVSLVVSKLVSNTKNMYVGLVKKIIIVSDFFASKIIDFATQGALNTPISELTSNTNRRVLILAAYLREVANNPEQLKAIQEISEAIGVMGIEFIDAIKPSIDKIVDKLIVSAKQVGSKSAFGAVQTFFAIASSMIAAVPGIGGVVDMLFSIAVAFNSFMRVVRTFVESNSQVAIDTAEAAGKTMGIVRKDANKIMNMVGDLKRTMPAVPTELPVKQQSGGRYYKSHSNKMAKSRKRIETSVHRFKNMNHSVHSTHLKHSRTKKYLHY